MPWRLILTRLASINRILERLLVTVSKVTHSNQRRALKITILTASKLKFTQLAVQPSSLPNLSGTTRRPQPQLAAVEVTLSAKATPSAKSAGTTAPA